MPAAPCPPNPSPPPGTISWPARAPVSSAILTWARANLRYPRGTVVQANVGGQDVVARLEWHYHDPTGPVTPHGCHKGCTIYYPTIPISPGVQVPITVPQEPDSTNDENVLAGDTYYQPTSRGWIIAGTMGALAIVVGGFLLAVKAPGLGTREPPSKLVDGLLMGGLLLLGVGAGVALASPKGQGTSPWKRTANSVAAGVRYRILVTDAPATAGLGDLAIAAKLVTVGWAPGIHVYSPGDALPFDWPTDDPGTVTSAYRADGYIAISQVLPENVTVWGL